MNTMEVPSLNKEETLKDIIQIIGSINSEMGLQLHMIADALVYGSHPISKIENPDDPLTIMDSLRRERDKAAENLKLLTSIKGYLW